ncbi:MAG: rhodanese-like domain-containing protein [Calditerrivibrio sp.]|nr:rhodanese-like domain-containing protein [Calditerrivibrio sp.]
MKKVLTALMVLIFAIISSASDKPDMNVWRKMVAEAETQLIKLTPEQVKEIIDKKENYTLLDVRERSEYVNGWIEFENFLYISRGVLEPTLSRTGSLKYEDKIIVICKTGQRAALAGVSLKKMGYKNVYYMSGGMDEWIKKGFPIINEMGSFTPTKK